MSFRRYTRIFYVILMLLISGAGDAWALSSADIIIEGTTHGTVAVTSVNDATRLVTITVTPASGYYVNKSDIIVQKLVDPSLASARRTTPDIADALTVYGDNITSYPNNGTYTFTVPEGYAGALVTVTFTGMNPATATITPNSLIYTGEAQELVTLGTVVGGAATNPVTYSLTSGGPYTTTIPTGTNAGTYTVYYKVEGDATHAEGSGSVSVTINKAQITSVVLSNNAISYDGNPHTVGVDSVKAGTLLVPSNDYTFSGNTATAIGTHTVTVTVKNESVNFTGTATATFRIVEATVTIINSSTSGVSGLGGHYLLMANISASVLANLYSTTNDFTGIFEVGSDNDGNFYTIDMNGYNHALFNTINGGTVKNVMLKNVSISQSGNVGAIANEAQGYTRIYNCGILPNDAANSTPSTVASTDGYCGGLVGLLDGDSRVINCFSYANITNGTDVAGIVGHNNFASTTEVDGDKYTKLKTAVVNCMFYGNITGGTNTYPVYGGEKIVNNTATGINNYDFYRAEASVGTLTDYNCSWPANEEYLTHYEYYRYLLNSNRELCGWWVGAEEAPSGMSTTDVHNVPKDASLMAKWVLDPSIAPYPILKKFGKYASPVNIDADASWRITANEWEGKKLGTLKVTIDPGTYAAGGASTKSNIDFPITDMDTLRADYCYRKIQLPYYNTEFGNPNGADWAAKYGGNYRDNVVIGWKVSTSEGTTGELVENWETGYNFADRNCTAKDANRVFAQGGYYYVPNGVTSITITAQWASAIYLDNKDRYYDCVSVSGFVTASVDKQTIYVGSSTVTPFAPAGTRPTTLGNGKTVQNGAIKNEIPSSGSVYGNAIVLVGNHQEFVGGSHVKYSTNNTYGCTIMSADFDFDKEPDNCLIWQLGTQVQRQDICPIRFDFLPIVEMGMAMKEDGSTQYYSLGCYRPLGHFEITETSLIHFGQFEFSNKSRTTNAPLILNGGIFDQYAKGHQNYAFTTANDSIDYIIIGGNVRMPSFTPGAHVNTAAAYPTRHCAVNVIGGNIDYLYLTGNYNEGVTPNTDNPHCYIDGGRFKQVAAAGKEGIAGDVTFKINHSKIIEFYGGSTMDQSSGTNYKIVKGDIDVTIDNSIVDKYCGGPKFGNTDYANGKTIKTSATNTIFGVYYGGGNGGTSYVQLTTGKDDGERVVPYDFKISGYNPGSFVDASSGYMANYDMEIVNLSTGTNSGTAVYRSYFFGAQFSATNTGSITNNLTDCKVLTNFYGGGNLGGVVGNVTSRLDGTTHVYGSAFGAGFSATVPDVTIHEKDKVPPSIDVYTGIITPESGGTSNTYTWTDKTTINGTSLSTDSPIAEDTDGTKYFYTTKSLSNLGAVSGEVILTITGNSIVDNDVYGGGDASAVSNTTSPANASTTVNISGNTQVLGNVYGGGNRGLVSGNATVNIRESEPITTP